MSTHDYLLSEDAVIDELMRVANTPGTVIDVNVARSLAFYLCEDVPTDALGSDMHLSLVAIRDDAPMSTSELEHLHNELDEMLSGIKFAVMVGAAEPSDLITTGTLHDYVVMLLTERAVLNDDAAWTDDDEALLTQFFDAFDDVDFDDAADDDWDGDDYYA